MKACRGFVCAATVLAVAGWAFAAPTMPKRPKADVTAAVEPSAPSGSSAGFPKCESTGWEAAEAAHEEFERRFVKKEVPDEIEERTVEGRVHKLAELLAQTGMAASKGEARRLIDQGGVKVNGEKASAANAEIDISSDGVLLQVGKLKFLRVKVL